MGAAAVRDISPAFPHLPTEGREPLLAHCTNHTCGHVWPVMWVPAEAAAAVALAATPLVCPCCGQTGLLASRSEQPARPYGGPQQPAGETYRQFILAEAQRLGLKVGAGPG